MNIFLNNFKRLLSKNLDVDFKSTKITHQKLKNFQKLYDINDNRIFYRFPKKELATILRQQCPVTDDIIDQNSKNNSQQINLSENDIYRQKKANEIKTMMKKLRFVQEVSEEHVCSKCTRNQTCKVANIVPQEIKKTQFSDLLFVLDAFAGVAEQKENLILQQKLQQEEENKIQQQKEIEEEKLKEEEEEDYRSNPLEKLEEQMKKEKKQKKMDKEQESIKNTSYSQNQIQEIEDIYSFKVWSSGLKLVDTCDIIMQDLQDHNGIETKKFTNLVQEETYKNFKKMKEFQKEQKNKNKKSGDIKINKKENKKNMKNQKYDDSDNEVETENFVKSAKSNNNNNYKNSDSSKNNYKINQYKQQTQKYNHQEYKQQKLQKMNNSPQSSQPQHIAKQQINVEDIQLQAMKFDKFMSNNSKNYKVQDINKTEQVKNNNNKKHSKNQDFEFEFDQMNSKNTDVNEQTTVGKNLRMSNRQDKRDAYTQQIREKRDKQKQEFESIENDNLLLREIDYSKQKRGGRKVNSKSFKFTKTKN